MAQSLQKFGVIGGGAWGTALALSLIRAGRDVVLWLRDEALAEDINTRHENTLRLPGVALDAQLAAATDIKTLQNCDVWVLAVPAQATRAVAQQLAMLINTVPIILVAKGIERGTSKLLSDVIAEELPGHACAVLSGPSFAAEVAKGLPTALTLAMKDKAHAETLAAAIAVPMLRIYASDDLAGVQIGGAVKNVLAIASGIVTGRRLGENARAAIITRGLAELARLGLAIKGRPETMAGLSGLGDLVLTCSSATSRNMALGIALGEGRKLSELMAHPQGVTEGVATAAAALGLADKHGVDMPIVAAVDAVLNRGASIDDVIASLLTRPLKSEHH